MPNKIQELINELVHECIGHPEDVDERAELAIIITRACSNASAIVPDPIDEYEYENMHDPGYIYDLTHEPDYGDYDGYNDEDYDYYEYLAEREAELDY